jgi:hypothetical protein
MNCLNSVVKGKTRFAKGTYLLEKANWIIESAKFYIRKYGNEAILSFYYSEEDGDYYLNKGVTEEEFERFCDVNINAPYCILLTDREIRDLVKDNEGATKLITCIKKDVELRYDQAVKEAHHKQRTIKLAQDNGYIFTEDNEAAQIKYPKLVEGQKIEFFNERPKESINVLL